MVPTFHFDHACLERARVQVEYRAVRRNHHRDDRDPSLYGHMESSLLELQQVRLCRMYPHSFLNVARTTLVTQEPQLKRAYRITDWVDPNAPLVLDHLANSLLQFRAVDSSIEVMDEECVAQDHYVQKGDLALPDLIIILA